MKKLYYFISWVAIFCAIGLTILVIFWLTYPYRIAEQTAPTKILTPVVRNGEEVRYELSFCKYMDITPIESRRQIVDGLIYRLPEAAPRVLDTGCRTVIATTPIILPECAECFHKEVYLQLTAIYQVNPLRRVEVTFTTDKFIIIPRDND